MKSRLLLTLSKLLLLYVTALIEEDTFANTAMDEEETFTDKSYR